MEPMRETSLDHVVLADKDYLTLLVRLRQNTLVKLQCPFWVLFPLLDEVEVGLIGVVSHARCNRIVALDIALAEAPK
jgi:hypothetical protein